MAKKFIAIDGLDGSGKTTLIKQLVKSLSEKGQKTAVFSAIGAGHVGGKLRDILKYANVNNLTASHLVFAARAELYLNIIQSVDDDTLVILDRSFISNLIYQGLLCEHKDYSKLDYILFCLSNSHKKDFISVTQDLEPEALLPSLVRNEVALLGAAELEQTVYLLDTPTRIRRERMQQRGTMDELDKLTIKDASILDRILPSITTFIKEDPIPLCNVKLIPNEVDPLTYLLDDI